MVRDALKNSLLKQHGFYTHMKYSSCGYLYKSCIRSAELRVSGWVEKVLPRLYWNHTYMHIYAICTSWPQRPEECFRFPEIGVTTSYELWELEKNPFRSSWIIASAQLLSHLSSLKSLFNSHWKFLHVQVDDLKSICICTALIRFSE